ncbi:MAG TPA: hypothetical protein ENI79_06150 [Rhodospirillales bacterium]|nr:hypothetical protein [Rhodospirillales bacterium]
MRHKRNIVNLFLGSALSVALLTGCLTEAQQFAGGGPITISPEVAEGLKWHNLLGTGYMTVSPDGSHYALSYCDYADCNSADLNILLTLDECRDKARRECKLFAQDGVVVWRGPWRAGR